MSGVSEYPSRVKCAMLAWHALQAAIEGAETTVSTEYVLQFQNNSESRISPSASNAEASKVRNLK